MQKLLDLPKNAIIAASIKSVTNQQKGQNMKFTTEQLDAARLIVVKAKKDLGDLSFGQQSDLLMDNLSWLKSTDEARELVRLVDRFTTHDGLPIIARGCAEDNSGVACQINDTTFEVRTSYPCDAVFKGFDLDGDPIEEEIYTKQFTDKEKAIKFLRYVIGA